MSSSGACALIVLFIGDVQKPAEGVQFRFGMRNEQGFHESVGPLPKHRVALDGP